MLFRSEARELAFEQIKKIKNSITEVSTKIEATTPQKITEKSIPANLDSKTIFQMLKQVDFATGQINPHIDS